LRAPVAGWLFLARRQSRATEIETSGVPNEIERKPMWSGFSTQQGQLHPIDQRRVARIKRLCLLQYRYMQIEGMAELWRKPATLRIEC